jgi:Tfp pilus assembly protein FimT
MRIANPFHSMEIAPNMLPSRKIALALASMLATTIASPVFAEGAPSTRLVSCGAESCLLVTGHRDSRAAVVRINGHPVEVQGERSWRLRLPVSTLRNWAAPFARQIEVSSQDPASQTDIVRQAQLPIGLLGHAPDLASLVITLN